MATEHKSNENFTKWEKANLKSLWKNLKIKVKKDQARHKKKTLTTGGGGPAESEGIIDLLPNQFVAIENEFDEDYVLEKRSSSGQSHETANKSPPSTLAEVPSIFVVKSGKKKEDSIQYTYHE
ncbi:hypothetical protein PoB_003183000 [Plakobranchus ocellatus]|uniref:Uncharacterized protein n=1 Tax=Plakobranchus ocellatus TaxID=259542 RepID=A0AAV4AEY7_9GAST|nr:hypothetical protein PoB_003183000 [Plakobranchus ocellatus]